MHQDECEDSWRPAGFRVLDRTSFLACCAQKGHQCWDQTRPEPPLLIDDVQPPKSALDRALLDIIKSSDLIGMSDSSKAEKAKKLLAIGADFQTSMYLGHNSSLD